ncbi:MAG: FG-GAP repeat domain-containing protein [Myxococcales bacterium]
MISGRPLAAFAAGALAAACRSGPPAGAGAASDAGPCSGCEIRGCAVGGRLFDAGEANPGSVCQLCSPLASRDGWTDREPGSPCDAGAVCASGQCLAGCWLSGAYAAPGAPSPGNPCQSCQPALTSFGWSPAEDGLPCREDGGTLCVAGSCRPFCSLGGAIVADGTLDAGNPDVCCNVALSADAWTPGFAAGAPVSVAIEPSALALGDFNGDGVPDLAVAHPGLSAVGILLGTGDAAFGPEVLLAVGPGPSAVALADFDGDGRLDLAVANGGGATVDVLLQQAGGGFVEAPGAPLALPGPGPAALAAADLNGDGVVDLVVADQGRSSAGVGEVSVFLGAGAGTFQPPAAVPVGLGPLALAVADLDGDGVLDLAAACVRDQTVTVLLGLGDGGFAEPPAAVLPLPAAPLALAAVDLSGRGLPDLVALGEGADGGALAIFPNQAQRPWFGGSPLIVPAGRAVAALASGDFDGDGRADLAVLDQGTGSAGVFLDRTADGGIAFALMASYAAGRSPSALAVADLDGDGRPDMAIADTGGGFVAILLGNCP